jgi:hypothetical protein
MKGQLEISFQWLYVLLAGGAFLVMFFFVFRACTQQGDERMQVGALRTQAASLNSFSWQLGERNITLDANAACIGGSLLLTKEDTSSSLNGPIFLSPKLAKSTSSTKEFVLSMPGVPALPLGNIEYVIDQSTQYYILTDAGQKYKEITAILPQVRTIAPSASIPADAIVASYDSLSGKSGRYGISFTDDEIIFYSRTSNGLQEVRRIKSSGAPLRAGALIAATPESYSCTKDQIVKRASYLQNLYSRRIGALPESDCTPTLIEANNTLTQATPLSLLDPDSQSAQRVLLYQQTLNGMGCPVIG